MLLMKSLMVIISRHTVFENIAFIFTSFMLVMIMSRYALACWKKFGLTKAFLSKIIHVLIPVYGLIFHSWMYLDRTLMYSSRCPFGK